MGVLDRYREQYPQYRDVPDDVLADGIYRKHYDGKIGRDDFMSKIGLAPRVQTQEERRNDPRRLNRERTPLPTAMTRPGRQPVQDAAYHADVLAQKQERRARAEFEASRPEPQMSRLESAAGSIGQGVTDVVSGIPKGAAIAGQAVTHSSLGRFRDNIGAIDRSIAQIDKALAGEGPGGAPNASAVSALRGQRARLMQNREGLVRAAERAAREAGQPIESYPGYRAGVAMQDWARDVRPTDPGYQGDFWTDKLPRGAGSFAGYIAAYATGGPIAAGTAGAAGGAVSQYEDAIASGADEQTALDAAGLGSLVGMTEVMPLFRIMSPGGKQGVIAALQSVAASSGEEAAQEAAAQAMHNVIAMNLYDPERNVMDNVGEGALIGAILGGGGRAGRIGAERGAEAARRLLSEDPGKALGREMGRQLDQPSMADRIDAILIGRGLQPISAGARLPSQVKPALPPTQPAMGGAVRATLQSDENAPVIKYAAGARPDIENVDPAVIGMFGRLQADMGIDLPIRSGFRDPERNRRAGGARHSQHQHGKALDIDVSGLDRQQRLDLIQRASAMGFTGIGVYDNTVHLDTGPRRAWGPSHKRESVPEWAEGAIAQHLTGEASAAPAVASVPAAEPGAAQATENPTAVDRQAERAAQEAQEVADMAAAREQLREDAPPEPEGAAGMSASVPELEPAPAPLSAPRDPVPVIRDGQRVGEMVLKQAGDRVSATLRIPVDGGKARRVALGKFSSMESAQEAAREAHQRWAQGGAVGAKRPSSRLPKRPFSTAIVNVVGRFDPDGYVGRELRHAGITPRTAPGLFRRGGAQSLDNLPASEWDGYAGTIATDGQYLSQQAIIDAIQQEHAGAPVYSHDQQATADAKAAREDDRAAIDRALQDLGADWSELAPYHGEIARVMVDEGIDADSAVERWAIQTVDQVEAETNADPEANAIPFEPGEAGGSGASRTGSPERDAGPGEAAPGGGAGRASVEGEARAARSVDETEAGTQHVIPGAERISDRELAERQMGSPKRSTEPQKAAGSDGGLFDTSAKDQVTLFSKRPAPRRGDTFARTKPKPGSNQQPLFQELPGLPARPSDGSFMLDGEVVTLKPVDKPTRREGIRIRLQEIIGARIYQGKVKGKRAAGFYDTSSGEVRLRKFDDVEVMAHEMAHWMDFHSSNKKVWQDFRDGIVNGVVNPQVRDEIASVTYDPQKPQIEGWAEFIRLWLTQHDVISEIAPTATDRFERLLAKTPRFDKQMRDLRREMHKWYRQGDMAQAIAAQGSSLSPRERVADFLQNRPLELARAKLVNRWHGAKVAEREMFGDILDGQFSAAKQFQIVNGVEAVYDAIMKWGTPKVEEDGGLSFRGKALTDVLRPVSRKGVKRFRLFMTYLAARRAHELRAQGRERLMTKAQISEALGLAGRYPEFEKVAAEYDQFNREMMDFYVDMKLITPDQKAAFQEANQFYVPFHRIVERLEGKQGGASAMGARLHGGTRNLNFLEQNIAQALFSNVRAAYVARAKSTLMRQISTDDDGALFAVRISTDSTKVRAHVEDMARKVAAVMAAEGVTVSSSGEIVSGQPGNGPTVDVVDIEARLRDNPELLMLWQHGQDPKTTGTYVDSAIIDGERVWFEVRDPVLFETLSSWGGVHSSRFMAPVFAARNILTRTVTMMPPFFLANAFRDTVSGGVLSTNGQVPFIGTLRGIGHAIAGTDLYKEWKLNGGGWGTRIQSMTEDGSSRANLGVKTYRPLAMAARAMSGIDEFLSAFENGTRIEEYRLARKAGKDRIEAAVASREVSTDFGNRGSMAGWVTLLRTSAFMNAALQGLDKFGRSAIFEQRGKQRIVNAATFDWAKAILWAKGAVIAAGSMAIWLWNNEDDERREKYEALTDDERGRYWHIFDVPALGDVRFPKPHDIGALFGTIPEVFLDTVAADNSETAAGVLGFTMTNTLLFGDFPSLIGPWQQARANRSFTGAPIIPERLRDAPPHLQYRSSTPEIYRLLGKHLGVSPLKAQHYIKGHFGYLENAIAEVAESAMWDEAAWGERPFPNDLTKQAVKHFTVKRQSYRTRYTEGYYEMRQRAMGLKAALSVLEAEAVRDGGAAMTETMSNEVNATLVELSKRFTKIDKQLSGMRSAIASITYDPSKTRAQKESEIEALYAARNDLLKGEYLAAKQALEAAEKRMRSP